MVQHMPHSGSAASGSILISRQSSIPSANAIENVEKEAPAVQIVTTSVVQAVTELVVRSAAESTEPAIAEQAEEIARTEVAHRGYRNTRVSVTILKRHQSQAAGHIHSFDITDPTFEKEILTELITYGEEDDTGEDENDEPSPEFWPHDNDPEGPNFHAEEAREVRISVHLSP